MALKVELLSIGSELLNGQTLNTNTFWLGKELENLGIEVTQNVVIPDIKPSILHALNSFSLSEADVVICTGGLGPTSDDITKTTIAEFFETTLMFNEDTFKHIQGLFQKIGKPMPDSNKEQAYLPKKCFPLKNELGTAPGMYFKRNGKKFFFLPGVPHEMRFLFEHHIVSELIQNRAQHHILNRKILTIGIGESALMEKISTWEKEVHLKGVGLAYLPSLGNVLIKITKSGDDKVQLEKELNDLVDGLFQIVPEYIASLKSDNLTSYLSELLIGVNKTISIAESCTGGYLSHIISLIPGCSEYYLGSIISYSNEVKNNELDVPLDVIDEHGAVSEPVVELMSYGVKEKLKSDYSIAISGIAGPSGDTSGKPIGTVWIAVRGNKGYRAKCFHFGKDRFTNIQLSAHKALGFFIQCIKKEDI